METRRFAKILIANRGEIALRVIRTCRAMGISTVAVYSDADSRALHVRCADEAVCIGPAPARESYLNIQGIIEAARRTGSEAIHPGYGFLSENADFADACEAAGLAFVGPPADAIRRMGLKSEARQMMADAGVPVVPGYHGEDQSLDVLSESARSIGLPVLIKASAGGGGKGMRIVRDMRELEDAIGSARREAEKAFGNGTLLAEKYIERARHVEVQILGDNHGNLVHLLERECSIQRRHQKVIEESPSPALKPDLRKRICEAAVAAGRAIAYTSAGTVEFILAPSGEFYFIEVNTRLQVEHPVTEMTTGLDLVRLQIETAEGKPLSIAQDDIRQSGHAIEARLYAEDPRNNFLPATGTVHEWDEPGSIEGLRIDAGIDRGMEIGIHYDPLLAKVIAYGSDREAARRKLIYGLRSLVVLGVQTNRDFLMRVLEHRSFADGVYHTGLLDERLAELVAQTDANEHLVAAAIVALYIDQRRRSEAAILRDLPPNYRNNPFRNPSMRLRAGGDELEVSWLSVGAETWSLVCGAWHASARIVSVEQGTIRVALDGVQRLFRIAECGDEFFVQSGALTAVVTRRDRYPRRIGASGHESAFAPMPGQVLRILVEVGQKISVGEPLVILEAMKMEQTLRAGASGIVEAVLVKQGDVVAPGDALVKIAGDASS